ncbi:uncharacterized protein LOC131670912 isoform X2 [Phymastichus coffea]|uniref:uncharacterized protein LOC131670912 isoform X2 n=1 Tax=Phymastichus coffea TaxID=108790 RepID=UPI00273B2716|nr:uncharacterized protein LOC131670912 isoform X2 [Phymastichus coffea]
MRVAVASAKEGRSEAFQDFKWALGLNRLSLRLMGVWPNERDLDEELTSVTFRVPAMIATISLCLFLPQMYALVLVFNELPLVIDNLVTSCSALTSCVKLYFVWRSKTLLWPVVESVKCDWLRPKRSWEREAMKREAARARLFTISGYVVLAGCYSGFAFAPLFGINIRMISNITDYGDRLLMVQSYLPYDYSKSPAYEITQTSQLIAGFFIGMAVSIPDNYYAALVFHVSAQFEILGDRIERFIKTDPAAETFSSDIDFQRSVGVFIDRHVHLIALVTAVEESFNFVIAAQILCMSVVVCCLGFQILGIIGGNEDKPSLLQIVTLVGTLFTLMMHTLVDCFASETLASRSSGFFHNVYNCKWYTIPQYDTRLLIPMMLLSKIPRKLTAGKIFHLSLSTYCNILKSTASYISMLLVASGR